MLLERFNDLTHCLLIILCSVIYHSSVPISVYILFFTKWWYLMVIYIIWIYLDRKTPEKGARPNMRIIKSNTLMNYFPVNIHVAENCKLNPKKNYILANYPHAIFACALQCIVNSPDYLKTLFPHHIFLSALYYRNYWLPFTREFLFMLNYVSSSEESINYMLEKPEGGNVIIITPDGLEGMLLSEPGIYKCYLKKRKGFIRVALKNGSPIIPSLTFGEVDLFYRYEKLEAFRRWIKEKLGYIVPIYKGRGWIQPSVVPYKKPLNVVIGKPIELQKSLKPSTEDIDLLHETYTQKLIELFEEYKHQFIENADNVFLEVI